MHFNDKYYIKSQMRNQPQSAIFEKYWEKEISRIQHENKNPDRRRTCRRPHGFSALFGLKRRRPAIT
jgi:hypothetical protein